MAGGVWIGAGVEPSLAPLQDTIDVKKMTAKPSVRAQVILKCLQVENWPEYF